MLIPRGSGIHPFNQKSTLFIAERFLRPRWWHLNIRILRQDAIHECAVSRIATFEDGNPIANLKQSVLRIQTQIRLPRLFVWTMAGETDVTQNGTNVARKIDLAGLRRRILCVRDHSIKPSEGNYQQ